MNNIERECRHEIWRAEQAHRYEALVAWYADPANVTTVKNIHAIYTAAMQRDPRLD